MKHGSLFSGIGGFDLAAEWMGWENVFRCEWNEFGQKILKHYWPNAISYTDITKTDFSVHRGTIDILTGGFPCQGFSLAGNRLGTDDDRYLWPEMLRVIRETKPAYIVGENVTGILSMEDKSGIWSEAFAKVESRKVVRYENVDIYEALYTRQSKMLIATICEDLENEGYEVQPIAIPAAGVGAPHRRERIWFIAYSGSERFQQDNAGNISNDNRNLPGEAQGRQQSVRIGTVGESWPSTDADNQGFQTLRIGEGISQEKGQACTSTKRRSVLGTRRNWDGWPTQPPVCSRNDGFSSQLDGITLSKWRTESIKAAGNAIVPQVAFEIFKAITQTHSHQ